MESNHTPGPWRVEDFGYSDRIEIRSEDFGSFRKIAKIHVPRIGDRICEIDMMTAKANAVLIAAAPEMLEMLVDVMKNLHVDMHETEIQTMRKRILVFLSDIGFMQ